MTQHLVAFSPDRPGYDAWHPARNVVARFLPHTIDRSYALYTVIQSSHPDYVVGKSYRRCVYQTEEAYEENGKFYLEDTEAEIRFESVSDGGS